MKDKLIYLDNGATTVIKKEVVDAMMPFFNEYYGNPSSIYELSRISRESIEKARMTIEQLLLAGKNTVYFTSGGSEADNWAIKGVAYANKSKGNHIISSKIEHHAVLHTLEYLEKQGFEVTYLNVDENGLVSLNDLEAAIKEETILITIMAANNEVGVIQDIKAIGDIAKEHKVLFHTDAIQLIGKKDINLEELNIDLMSISAHKIHGPKGIGALYIKKGTKIDNLIHGGAQENRRRAGTENTAMIIGFAKAMELIYTDMSKKIIKMTELRERLIEGIIKNVSECKINGDRSMRLCNNVNISFRYIEGESILLMLDKNGIAASSGSACTSRSLDPSHVLLAMGMEHELAHGSIRFTLSDDTSEEEVDYVISVLPSIIERLRNMSPLYRKEV